MASVADTEPSETSKNWMVILGVDFFLNHRSWEGDGYCYYDEHPAEPSEAVIWEGVKYIEGGI